MRRRISRAARSFVVIRFLPEPTFGFASAPSCTRFDIIVPAANMIAPDNECLRPTHLYFFPKES
jgi:hypothetical protein